MSVLRAILGRFARLLVRLARRLDPELAETTDGVAPGRMAALRLRYPGAPDHWLRLAARYSAAADRTTDEPAPRPEVEEYFFPPDQSGRRPALKNGMRDAEGLEHPRPRAAGTRAARPIVAARLSRTVAKAPPTGPRLRPRLSFPSTREREPVVRLVRPNLPDARRPILRFQSSDQPQSPEPDRQAYQPEPIRGSCQSVFPPVETHAPERPEWPRLPEADREPAAVDDDAHWPVANHRARLSLSWLGLDRSAKRRETRFNLSDNRWPELPSLPDESSPPLLSARDEAALIAEQIGGTWSA